MALDIGELVGRLRIDQKEFDKGLDQGKKSFSGFADKLTGLAAAGGLAAAAALGGALLAGMEAQNVGARVAAQLGEGSERAKEYGKIAGSLYADGWGASLAEVGEALSVVAQQARTMGLDATTDDLKAWTREATIIVDLFGQDMPKVVQSASQMVKNGLVPDMTAAFDLITTGMQEGVNKSDDLLDTMNEYSTQFRALGLSGAEAMGLMNQALQGGARDSDTAADALKEFAIRSKDLSKLSMDSYRALGLNGQAMSATFAKGGPAAAKGLDTVLDRLRALPPSAEKSNIAIGLFGTKAEDLQGAFDAMDLDSAATGFDNVAGAAEKAGKTLSETDAAKMETFKRQVMATAQAFAVSLIPMLKDSVKFIRENKEWLGPLAVALGSVAAAIVIINVATKAWAAATAAYTTVQWALDAALAANPIGLVIIAIAALIAIIVLIATKTTWFQTAWEFVWGGIKAITASVWGWIRDTLWPGIRAVFDALGAAAMWLWHNVFEPVWNGITAAMQFAWRIINSVAALIAYDFKVLIAEPAMWLWNTVIKPVFQSIGDAAMWLWNTVLTPAFNGIMAAVHWVGDAAMWLWNSAIGPAFRGIAAVATWLWTNVIQPVFGWISGAVNVVGGVIQSVFAKVGGWIGNAFSSAAGIVKGALNGVIAMINLAIGGINSIISKANAIPGVDFPSIPRIPRLAAGGVVSPRAGGTPVIMGDGGQVEYGVPEDKLLRLLGKAQALGAAGGGAGGTVRLVIDWRGVMREIRTEIKAKGGDVQTVLGGR